MIDVTLGMKQILLNTLEDVFLKDYLDKFSKVMPGATRADIWRLFEKEYDVVFDTLIQGHNVLPFKDCLLYTSDAADDLLCVDLGGRRIIKKKKKKTDKNNEDGPQDD